MSVSYPPARPAVQLSLADAPDHRRQLGQASNRQLQGHMNCTLFVTLDPNVNSTMVVDSRISAQTYAGMMPQTSDAGAEIAAGGLFVNCTNGSLVISHANNANADRSFVMCLIG